MRPYREKTLHKKRRVGGVAQCVGPEFKSQYCKKNILRQKNIKKVCWVKNIQM
jgi:hypothetical protein